jgi:AraC-like DNA-binding protein
VICGAGPARGALEALVEQLVRGGGRGAAARRIRLLTAACATLLEARQPGRTTRWLAPVHRYAAARVARRLTPADLAAHGGLSVGYFARRVRRTLGLPPRRWLVHLRIDAAAGLLDRTDLTITQVARRLGYAELYLFSRQFRQVTGLTPRAWRRAGRSASPCRRLAADLPSGDIDRQCRVT